MNLSVYGPSVFRVSMVFTLNTLTSESISLHSLYKFIGTDEENLFSNQDFLGLVIVSVILMILMNDSAVL